MFNHLFLEDSVTFPGCILGTFFTYELLFSVSCVETSTWRIQLSSTLDSLILSLKTALKINFREIQFTYKMCVCLKWWVLTGGHKTQNPSPILDTEHLPHPEASFAAQPSIHPSNCFKTFLSLNTAFTSKSCFCVINLTFSHVSSIFFSWFWIVSF